LFCFFQSRAKCCGYLTHFKLCCWLAILLILSGDIHENPGPDSSCNTSTSSFGPAESNISTCIIHYNVQSFFNKRDLLYRDLRNYNVQCIVFYRNMAGYLILYHQRYISSLIPSQVGNITSYNLRNSSNLRNISCRFQLLSKSFLPSTIDSWNSLTDQVCSAPSRNSFKSLLSRGRKDVPLFYYEDDRQTFVYYARLRTHCSNLNAHLFAKT